MTNHFTIDIRLANAQMLTASDVAEALRTVEYQLESLGDESPAGYTRPIRDVNGNTVGEWKVVDHKTGLEIAREVLDNHRIRADWRRTGDQILDLIDEGVRIARGEQ